MSAPYDVEPADEARHAPDAEELWNESYYCDFVQGDGSWGGWLRLGLYPNREVAWWTAWVVRPDEPGICSVDYAAPVPPGDTLVSESASVGRVEIDVRRPLETFRLAVDSPAVTLAKPSDAYRNGAGGATSRLATDLTWFTDGVPYHYNVTTRYEIPCTVRGTVTIDGETLEVDGHGQRDHSWGVRDWWAFGWCWCSLRLDDGTRLHLSDIRVPGMPMFFGYVQRPGSVAPLSALTVSEELVQHGFPSKARVEVTAGLPSSDAPPTRLGLDITPLAFGPVLLRNDDGRTSRFPRALLGCRSDDGRTGTGWIEWNQPDRAG